MRRKLTMAFRGAVAPLVVLLSLLTAAPAQASMGSYHWGYGTIYVQDLTPNNPYKGNVDNRLLYYHNLGAHWNVVEGDCRAGSPCIRLSVGTYPTTGEWQDVLGMTTYPMTCGGPATWCNSDGNVNNLDRVARVMINTAQILTYDEQRKTACHEFGHALAYLQHESNALGATCMNGSIGSNTPEFLNSTDRGEIVNRFAGIALAPCSGCSTVGAVSGAAPTGEAVTRR